MIHFACLGKIIWGLRCGAFHVFGSYKSLFLAAFSFNMSFLDGLVDMYIYVLSCFSHHIYMDASLQIFIYFSERPHSKYLSVMITDVFIVGKQQCKHKRLILADVTFAEKQSNSSTEVLFSRTREALERVASGIQFPY